MAQYINKSALVAEIKRRLKVHMESNHGFSARYDELKDILSFLDTLEVKEVQEEPVSNDLEETLKDYAYQVAYDLSNDWLEDNATWDDVETAVKLGAQWQKQQLIDKACDWLRQHMKTLPELSNKDLTKHTLWKRDEIIDKFRQAMEE